MTCRCAHRASVNGKVVEDTKARDKPIVAIYGGRPYTGGLCQGVEEALSTMQAGKTEAHVHGRSCKSHCLVCLSLLRVLAAATQMHCRLRLVLASHAGRSGQLVVYDLS